MTIRNLKDNSKKPWLADFYTNGREGIRIRKRFATKGEATTFEQYTMKEIDDKPWLGDKPEHHRLSALIEIWFTMYGTNLSNGKLSIKSLNTWLKLWVILLLQHLHHALMPSSAVNAWLVK